MHLLPCVCANSRLKCLLRVCGLSCLRKEISSLLLVAELSRRTPPLQQLLTLLPTLLALYQPVSEEHAPKLSRPPWDRQAGSACATGSCQASTARRPSASVKRTALALPAVPRTTTQVLRCAAVRPPCGRRPRRGRGAWPDRALVLGPACCCGWHAVSVSGSAASHAAGEQEEDEEGDLDWDGAEPELPGPDDFDSVEEGPDQGRELAVAMARVASDTKATDVLVLHVAPLVYWTSYLVR